MAMPPTRAATLVGAGAAFLCIAALLIWWPGVAAYDTTEQYRQALTGVYDDWHPPVMAHLWAMLHPLAPGARPMLIVQMALYWLGLGLVAAALARSGRLLAGLAVLAIGALPLFVGWQAVVLKDTQMLGAVLAAVGLVAWRRLAGERMPAAAIVVVAMLLAYALLLRANAVFAIVPLAVMLWPGAGRPWRRVVAVIAGTLVVLAIVPPINHQLLAARETKISHTLPIYDLAGIAHFSGADDGVLPQERALIEQRHCYQPFFWDPFEHPAHCGAVAARLNDVPRSGINRLWLAAIAHHPLAYAEHRLAHLNATDRLIVPTGWMNAQPYEESEPNELGLESPGMVADQLSEVAGRLAETPLGWPIAWIVVAVTGLWIAARRPASPLRDLALALAVSALSLEASFAIVSIAADLRYHLWPMVGTALMAVLLLAERSPPRRPLIVGGGVLALVLLAGTAARMTLPRAPADYSAMLGYTGQ
ncbi:hypothetical protein GCM10009087_24060 [Sphingomonas oligophenolica]|uniref:Glycosyltransferase RgtA/B/C/D-like domain-containing protein n=1 Tax=Sphingomonas oligophenolica TaxID=301154 RepID=A0ABU9Y1B9_9SPHN